MQNKYANIVIDHNADNAAFVEDAKTFMNDLVRNRSVIHFTPSVATMECYPEADMRGRVTGFRVDDDDPKPGHCLFRVEIDFSEFAEHNERFETPFRDGSYARNSPSFKQKDWWYIGPYDILTSKENVPYFHPMDDEFTSRITKLREAHADSKTTDDFTTWLEKMAMEAVINRIVNPCG